ncbi:hypothetical protein PRIPAC_87444 [Pristionchus pacificus]|uniref:Uncharacterized protein n=1 Tax=Pristionchus pacificus TaxID=54126 RepID=A0A2A6CV11_PRIPA|nr:hypothetical protein PRIPAC_87444 [Pristionchus pacificus]|eukprot:PDM81999.1 hypothetical protein PRIPAC_36392 [Pristionchus pacificus]
MVSFLKRVLNDVLPDKSERKLELAGDTHFRHHIAVFSPDGHPTESQIKNQFLKMKRSTPVKIVNSGNITVTERIVIVEKSTLTEFLKNEQEAWARNNKKSWKTDFKFIVKNKGSMHIVSSIYLVLDDVETFLKSGLFGLLADGIKWESPVVIKKNCATKKTEVVAQIGEEERKHLDQTIAFQFKFTDSDKNIMKKLSVKGMDLQCFKGALCTISA